MKKIVFIVLMMSPVCLFAQRQGQRLIDSLHRKLKSVKEDTNKVNILNSLASAYAAINTDIGINYGEQALQLSEQLGWEKGKAMTNNSLGSNYLGKADYTTALEYFNKSLKVNESLDNKTGIARSLRNIGMVNVSQGDYSKALEHFMNALAINEAMGDKSGVAKDLGNIGNVYQNKSNDALALEYLLKALKMSEELGDKSGIANNLNTIGLVYIGQRDYRKALENYTKALKLNEELEDKSNIARTLKNIGNGYFCLKDLDQAYENYNKALKINEELGDKSGIARNLGNIGNIYQEQGNYSKALEYLLKAYEMNNELGEKYPKANNLGSIGCLYLTIAKDTTDTINEGSFIFSSPAANLHKSVEYLNKAIAVDKEIGNLHELQNFAYYLSEAQELLGNYKEAYESYELYTTTKDSVFSTENNLKIEGLGEKRETELRQKQLEMQHLKIDAAKNEKRYYITGLAMLLLLCGGLFLRFRTARNTKKQLEEKNRIIATEKENADMLRIRAERSEKFKQQFLTNMSHEIRTPMNAVNGMTDLLIDKDPRPDQLHYLQIISHSSDILLHIINDILDLSKIESGKLELEVIDFSLADTVRQVKETLSFRAEEKGLYLVTSLDDHIPDVITGDPFRLNQVLINLGGNAIKFTEKGSVEINVMNVKTTAKDVSLLFTVIDTGIGIPEDKLHMLFESFKQVQSSDSRKYGGTGLGLSISKQLVELQGGTISVESAVGRGTTFSFELTFPKGSRQRLRERTQKEQKSDGSILNGLRILLTDDNEYNRMVASETLLLKADVTIDEAVNGEEAISLLELNDYDVVLMDIQMPVMNGLDATRHIRKLPSPKNLTPVIALTASLLREDVDLCTDAGMNTYVPKPFKAWQLISAIAEVTGRKDATTGKERKTILPEHIPLITGGIVNLAYLTDFCEGNEERMKKFIRVYTASVPAFMDKLTAAMAANNKMEISRHVHAFKPNWIMMGMKQSTEVAIKIEKLCKMNAKENLINNHISILLEQAKTSLKELENKC